MRKEKGLIEIRIAGLSDGVHEHTFTCRAADFRNPELDCPELRNDILVRVVANMTESEIVADIETATLAEFSCDICLAPVQLRLTGRYRVIFANGDEPRELESEEDYRALEHGAPSIDLTEDVRETLLLSRPMKVVCSDNPECGMLMNDAAAGTDEAHSEKNSWQESLEKLKNRFH
ncbi:hypothetical protein CHL67_00885 [Prosthecochloris sp. GSB1]|uniref:YceD family protein n=1 Tax=Prosthecochloris sp. GSB1 TaxID=281093 RepID=UPI000B8CD31B|nr:DUF177 domain-containing protein [Prosthecochloris sp. GSB1]ASQ89667.1 hypothetical protein CHL67_00885 [Prosthecochloris sp. GSB1]